jgi:hypothetical protein
MSDEDDEFEENDFNESDDDDQEKDVNRKAPLKRFNEREMTLSERLQMREQQETEDAYSGVDSRRQKKNKNICSTTNSSNNIYMTSCCFDIH